MNPTDQGRIRRPLFSAAAAASAALLSAGVGLAQVAPGERPSPIPAHFPPPRPTPTPTPPPVVITRPPVVRSSFPSRANPMPGRMDALPGGPRRDLSGLYRPALSAPASAVGRGSFPERTGFISPGPPSGVPAGVNAPNAIGAAAFFETSGFSGNLAFNDDRFRFSAHLGSGALNFHPRACLPIGGLTWPCLSWPYSDGYYQPYPSYYGYVYGSSWPVVNYAMDQYADPALSPRYIPQQVPIPTPPPPPPPSAMELAVAYMQAHEYGEAIKQFRAQLKADKSDYLAMRWLGVAQLLAGKTKDGCDTIAKAYEADAALGDSILNIDQMQITQLRIRELCGPVVAYAKRSSLPGAYVAAAMLMQVRDRADLSIKMLTEAKAAGLDAELYAKLSQSMTK